MVINNPKRFSLEAIKALNLEPATTSRAACYRVYGDPGTKASASWQKENLVKVVLPYSMRLAWDSKTYVTTATVHKKAVDLPHILNEIALNIRFVVKAENPGLTTMDYDLLTLKELDKLGLREFGGTYNHRLVRGGSKLSSHSWGIAIDINPVKNGLGNHRYTMPEWVIKIFESYGWTAGARWSGSRCDAMHFSRGGF